MHFRELSRKKPRIAGNAAAWLACAALLAWGCEGAPPTGRDAATASEPAAAPASNAPASPAAAAAPQASAPAAAPKPAPPAAASPAGAPGSAAAASPAREPSLVESAAAQAAAHEAARLAEAASGPLRITYPQDGTLFPPEIVAPTVTWSGAGSGPWTVVVRSGGEEKRYEAATRSWRPSEDDWRSIKQRSVGADAEIVVRDAAAPPAGSAVRIRTSSDPVGDALFYREVPLPFLHAVQDPSRIRWRFGTIDSVEAPPIVLQNLPVCGNCHSFADDASVLGLDVDYGNDKGAYAVLPVSKEMVLNDEKILSWADFRKEDGELTFGLLSRVSPDGRYVVSTVKDRSVFVATPDIWFSQLFFPIKGILVVYDRKEKTFRALPGADDPAYVQTNAVWSPDGREIVFARTTAYKPEKLEQKNAALIDEKDVPEFTRDKKPFRYDLFRIPFNDGKGGTPVPIEGASGDGRSNYFPKYSPDGRWIVFTKSDSYMLLQPDSELWIMPAAGGKARRLGCNTRRMNSWHSWSSNSRWLVFSSKVNTPYTQLFLTHIDEQGRDTPPVLLERFTSADRAANIPEFVRLPGDAIAGIREEFLDAYSFLRAGMANEHTGDHAGAEKAYRRGLEVNPDHAELRNALGWTLYQAGRTREAVAEFEKALAVDGGHAKAHNNLALALVELGRLEDAATHYRRSAELDAKCEIVSDLGVVLARLGRADQAAAEFRRAVSIDPHCAAAHGNLAVDDVRAGRWAEAEAHYREAVAGKPTATTHHGLGYVLARQGRTDEAVAEFRAATEADPAFAPAWRNLGEVLAATDRLAEAEAAYRRALDQGQTAPLYNGLGTVLARQGRTDEAAREFRNALALDQGNAEAASNLAALGKGRKP